MLEKSSTKLLINCDVGEWDAPHLSCEDDSIMPLVDMCNIACGGHAGSKKIMRMTLDSATKHNVKIGAHPGFEDRENFGRKYHSLTENQLTQSLEKQIEAFLSVCSKKNIIPHHIKAHGALYHACNQNEMEANALIKVITHLAPSTILLVAPNSRLVTLAKSEGIEVMTESFIDRRYLDDLTLMSRNESTAVITNPTDAKQQFELLSKGKIKTQSETVQSLLSTTACIHGDNPNVIQILQSIRSNHA